MKWKELYNKARGKLNPRTISPFIDAGGVAAAILTDSGIEILVNVETEKTVKLSELLPDWWGSDRFI